MKCFFLFLKIGYAVAVQEYRACENSFQCTSYCNMKGFNDRVCKTVTVDESPNIDGTALVNRRACLCSESSKFSFNCGRHQFMILK